LRDLLKNPIWKNLELGHAIPDSIHAVSVALPTWNDVINYEEKDQECMIYCSPFTHDSG
jgi:cystathionine gamma-synthase